MSHIPNETLQQLKQNLLDRKSKLSGVQREVDNANPVNDENRGNDNASPDTDAREEMGILQSEAVGEQVGDMLTRIEAALDRIEKGTYGHTADGKEIPVERLLVDPTATTLVQ